MARREESPTICSPSVTSDGWKMPRGRVGKEGHGQGAGVSLLWDTGGRCFCSPTQLCSIGSWGWQLGGWHGKAIMFFKKTLVTHRLHQNGSPCIPCLSWMIEKSWSVIDLITSEILGHSSGGMFMLLGRSNVSQLRWGWKSGRFRKGSGVLEDHQLNVKSTIPGYIEKCHVPVYKHGKQLFLFETCLWGLTWNGVSSS